MEIKVERIKKFHEGMEVRSPDWDHWNRISAVGHNFFLMQLADGVQEWPQPRNADWIVRAPEAKTRIPSQRIAEILGSNQGPMARFDAITQYLDELRVELSERL